MIKHAEVEDVRYDEVALAFTIEYRVTQAEATESPESTTTVTLFNTVSAVVLCVGR